MAAVLSESVLDQNGPNDHFGRNDLIPNWILAFARPKWTKIVQNGPFWPQEVHFGPFRSANRSLAILNFTVISVCETTSENPPSQRRSQRQSSPLKGSRSCPYSFAPETLSEKRYRTSVAVRCDVTGCTKKPSVLS